MFIPTLLLWYSTNVIKAFNSINIKNVYMGSIPSDERTDEAILELINSIEKVCIFHIVVENNSAFYTHLPAIKGSSFYKGMYSLDARHTVIKLRGFGGNAYIKFLQGKYSEMFGIELLERCKDVFMPRYEHEYKVLAFDQELVQEIADKYGLVGNDVDNIKELDAKPVFADEVLVE